jgi:hypothetical protein
MSHDLERRVVELETRLAFQEQALTELSDALAATRLEAGKDLSWIPQKNRRRRTTDAAVATTRSMRHDFPSPVSRLPST